ncbi:uroporphyrinogen-III synthase [Buchnera aphidicola (Hyadaphis tataricae)]|uniref:Uroporphyrinogen-III synthase n=1 Tax=Buchnera aphidicola (Hyadaphis tataricae) TaxID=1241859 RepID=A0A4D6Y6B9_9GAMM|nr:uroporphyrinogen-III synthase [Buchnera aphidicola]QCI21858.1 uroporphyrinogen-III synthase [Buchnera aphidicola (Hyadaphis tataricae)]
MTILVIRPSPTGEELVKNLNENGILSYHFSFYDFYPSFTKINLSNKVDELYQSDVIVFFSKTSIYYTDLFLKQKNLKWPFSVKYFTIGQSTAFFLHKHVQKKIFFPKNNENSENLLHLLNKHLHKKNKIVLLQGENGRTLVQKILTKNGFQVSVIECYKRKLRISDIKQQEKTWRLYHINALVITSSEVLFCLKKVFSKNNWLFQCKLFVVSKRLSKIAECLGWNNITVSRYASNHFLLKIIQETKF